MAGRNHEVQPMPTFTYPSLTAGACLLLSAGVALADRPTLHPNPLRYSERNPSAATGRSGTAQVSFRALYSPSQESTQVQLSTGGFDGAAPAPGQISKVQLKLLAASGRPVWTSNQNRLAGGGAVNLTFGNLRPGERLQAQAHVQGIDGRRTDVVTARTEVRRRPDLAVTRLELPPRARRDSVVNIQATVTEMNGDLGARADCVLVVDGARVDRAVGIWVDAGRSVSCAFSHRFTAAGSRNVQVLAENVVPADDVAVNNDQDGSIVIFEDAPLGYSASAWSRTVHNFSRSEGTYDDQTWTKRDWSSLSQTDGWEESVNVQAWTAKRVSAPLAIAVWEGQAGAETLTFDRSGWNPPFQWGDDSCGGAQGHEYEASSASWLYFSSSSCDGNGWTEINYQRYAGDVVYFSSGYEVYWYHTEGTEYRYAWNTSSRDTQGTRLIDAAAPAHRVRLHLHDGTLRVADVQIPLQPFSNESNTPLTCYQYDFGYFWYECSEQRSWDRGASGSAVSAP